ncbi:aquaporin-9-like protein [Dinothrombium tinctorium]|uniref:Aquaporin-9-like protein n=1 Tax=Dinothrombium tinctorium TaxID=1965070 RepID=A0A443RH30_9ACAR|nr:aquaporin-9-like protein [Dinothrombium tinctorium]
MVEITFDRVNTFFRRMKFENQLIKQLIAEFFASFILVFMIDSAVATYGFLSKEADMLAIAVVAGVALYLALMVGAAAGAGHSTPIVTVALASVNKFPWTQVPSFMLVHHLGGMAAAVLTYINCYDAVELLENKFGNKSVALIFTSFPSEHTTPLGAFVDQFICCALIMYAVMVFLDEKHPLFVASAVKPSLGFILCGIVLCFELNTGAAVNPSRDLIGRLFLYIVGYGNDVFSPLDGNYWWTAGLIGPHLGAIAGTWLYYITIEAHHEDISGQN